MKVANAIDAGMGSDSKKCEFSAFVFFLNSSRVQCRDDFAQSSYDLNMEPIFNVHTVPTFQCQIYTRIDRQLSKYFKNMSLIYRCHAKYISILIQFSLQNSNINTQSINAHIFREHCKQFHNAITIECVRFYMQILKIDYLRLIKLLLFLRLYR